MPDADLKDGLIRVAIVEDLEDIRENVAEILDSTEGLQCIHRYKSAEEALKFLPLSQPDIVLLDIHLPVMDGVELLKQVRDKCPETGFIMFSVFEDSQHIFEALKAGASGYLTKKSSPSKIIESIRELHAGGSPMSPEIAKKVIDFIRGYDDTFDNNQFKLSPRELEIMEYLSAGKIYREIGLTMGIAAGTVKQYINNIYKKMQVINRAEAINKYLGRS